MAKAGRKRKQGKRAASGRLSRAKLATYDKGTEHAQAMQALYGTDGADAIGRAYRSGLLGHGNEAKAILDMARNISNAYWQAYSTGGFKSPLADKTHGTIVDLDHEKIRRREEWLSGCLDFVTGMGQQTRKAFYQLVIDVNPDSGPDWLDRLCWVEKANVHREDDEKLSADIADKSRLRAALDALEALCA